MGADDICTLSIGCLMTDQRYRAEAIVEEAAEAMMVPRDLFDRMMASSAAFRGGIMASYGRRLDDLMLLVEEVAFRRMDERLQEWLQERAAQHGVISTTHQEIAEELGCLMHGDADRSGYLDFLLRIVEPYLLLGDCLAYPLRQPPGLSSGNSGHAYQKLLAAIPIDSVIWT